MRPLHLGRGTVVQGSRTAAIGRHGAMQRLDGQLVLSPTDLTHHQECAHLTRLDLGVAAGEWAAPEDVVSPELDLIFERGLEHEKKYLESLRAQGKTVEEIETVFDAEGRRRAEAETVEAMRRGVDVVYQGTFFDGAWGGQADFLLRVDKPSVYGDWSYEIADTKLARKLKVAALLQMATYAERLTALQGVAPEFIHVVTGDGVSRPWRLIDGAAYARRARARLEAFVAAPPVTGPSPIGYCEQCRWASRCNAELRQADDLGLVAGMRGDQRDALRAGGFRRWRHWRRRHRSCSSRPASAPTRAPGCSSRRLNSFASARRVG